MATLSMQNGLLKKFKGMFGYINHASDTDKIDVNTDVNALVEEFVWLDVAAEAVAATEKTIEYFHELERNATIVEAQILPSSTLTANDTNYKVVQLQVGDGAGGTPASQATASTTTTGTGNWAAGVRELMTISDASVSGGEVLGLAIAVCGTGVATPQFRCLVRLRKD